MHLQLMMATEVSGAKNYQELYIAAKNKEKRLGDLKKNQAYARSIPHSSCPVQKPRTPSDFHEASKPKHLHDWNAHRNQLHTLRIPKFKPDKSKKCFYCNKPGHLMNQFLYRRKEVMSHGSSCPTSARQIVTNITSSIPGKGVSQADSQSGAESRDTRTRSCPGKCGVSDEVPGVPSVNPLSLLFSESKEEGDVKQVMVKDSRSRSQLAHISIQGVPADGVVDTAADITIMGGKLFAHVAAPARLWKKNFKPPDKVPRTYNRKVFRLDGRMEAS